MCKLAKIILQIERFCFGYVWHSFDFALNKVCFIMFIYIHTKINIITVKISVLWRAWLRSTDAKPSLCSTSVRRCCSSACPCSSPSGKSSLTQVPVAEAGSLLPTLLVGRRHPLPRRQLWPNFNLPRKKNKVILQNFLRFSIDCSIWKPVLNLLGWKQYSESCLIWFY